MDAWQASGGNRPLASGKPHTILMGKQEVGVMALSLSTPKPTRRLNVNPIADSVGSPLE